MPSLDFLGLEETAFNVPKSFKLLGRARSKSPWNWTINSTKIGHRALLCIGLPCSGMMSITR